jgi:hypothetical protein
MARVSIFFDLIDGLNGAITLNWKEEATKFCIFIADGDQSFASKLQFS